MKSFELKIKAKHLIGAEFISNTDCGIARAIKNQLGTDIRVGAGTEHTFINDKVFFHEFYGSKSFHDDKLLAERTTDPETIIRTLNFTNDRSVDTIKN